MFDGASFVLDADRDAGGPAAGLAARRWRSTRWRRATARLGCAAGDDRRAAATASTAIYHAMMLGLRDYVNKNRFPGVVLGLSGGIDSALSRRRRGRRAGRRSGCAA